MYCRVGPEVMRMRAMRGFRLEVCSEVRKRTGVQEDENHKDTNGMTRNKRELDWKICWPCGTGSASEPNSRLRTGKASGTRQASPINSSCPFPSLCLWCLCGYK